MTASLPSPSDEELVRAAQTGTLEAFTALYDRYLPTVYKRVRFVIPEEDVEDVTQEIFIAVMKSLKSFRYEARFNTWLRTLVNRQVADYYRGRHPRESSLDELTDPEEGYFHPASITDQIEWIDDCIILRQALRQLPDHYREVILLRFADGLQFEQIAQVQSQSLDATKSLFRRAISSLHQQVNHGTVS
jgi:RNA polymerase sigma-70 factor, ECF subfamily